MNQGNDQRHESPARKRAGALADERGQGLVEYALIIALVSLAAIAALGFLSGEINDLFRKTRQRPQQRRGVIGRGKRWPPWLHAVPPTATAAVGDPAADLVQQWPAPASTEQGRLQFRGSSPPRAPATASGSRGDVQLPLSPSTGSLQLHVERSAEPRRLLDDGGRPAVRQLLHVGQFGVSAAPPGSGLGGAALSRNETHDRTRRAPR